MHALRVDPGYFGVADYESGLILKSLDHAYYVCITS